MNDKAAVYKIPEDIVNQHGTKNYIEFTNYVNAKYPSIKRGDALELGVYLGYPGRKEHFLFWDGKQVIPQCTDYYEYDGGGPPLSFKTFTEFPMDYFSEVAWFGFAVYLDYNTFVYQVKMWDTPEDDQDANLEIEYKGVRYSLNLDESEAYDSLNQYIDAIKNGEARHIIMVDSNNRIVNINGEEVYNEIDDDDEDNED